jgi:superkiller protein 3
MKTWAFAVALSAMVGTAWGQQAQQPQPGAQEYLAGEAALKKKDIDGAIANFEKSLAAGGPVACHYYLGMAYQEKKNFEKASGHYAKYVAAHPDVVDAQYRLAMSYRQIKKNGEAARHFKEVIKLKPDIAEPYYFVGQQEYTSQDYRGAKQNLGKFVQLKADSPLAPEAHYMLGHMSVIAATSNADPAADNEEAKKQLSKFLALKADSPLAGEAHFMLGTIAAKKIEALEPPEGEKMTDQAKAAITAVYTEASSHLTKFIELRADSPQAADAVYTLGSLAIRVEDDAAAKTYFEKFLSLRPESPLAGDVKKILDQLKQSK